MTASDSIIELTEQEAYQLRTVLNQLLRGNDMVAGAIEGRRHGDYIKITH